MLDSYTKEPATGLIAENVDPRSVTWIKDYGKLFQKQPDSDGLSYGWISHEHDMDIDGLRDGDACTSSLGACPTHA